MKYYLDRQVTLPSNHDRGSVTEWRRVCVGTTSIAMEFDSDSAARDYVKRTRLSGPHRVMNEDGIASIRAGKIAAGSITSLNSKEERTNP